VNGLVATLTAGGGTILAIVVLAWLMFRGGGGRWAIAGAFAAGSVLGLAGILWAVLLLAVGAVGQGLDMIMRAASGIG
jgi:hypothetical protein